MNNVGIAFSTKDRMELSRQTVAPLLQTNKFDLWWIDGSNTLEGQELPEQYNQGMHVVRGIKGGPDAAIVYALTELLKAGYEFIGLVENDVLLQDGWFERTMQLFERGRAEGLEVGAASARAFDDRILIQRDGYAVMLNLGAGMVIFSRRAVELILGNYRTGWWPDTRALFMQLCGIDGGSRGSAGWTSSDWHFDAILAQHGLSSLALTPCAAGMIGQIPPLEDQGLRLADREVDQLRNDGAFELYANNMRAISSGTWRPQTIMPIYRTAMNGGASLIFPHQLDGEWEGDWRLKWTQALGPFSWRANEDGCRLRIRIFGQCAFLVSGGELASKVSITDTGSGFMIDPEVPPHAELAITALGVPGEFSYREIVLTCAAGAVFYGIQAQEPQPISNRKFDYSILPRA